MCGIAGYWQSKGQATAELAERMAFQIRHRGPDVGGAWVDAPVGVALAHRLLRISDSGPVGQQPMVSPCGRYVLVCDGRIYNHADLRAELEAVGAHFDWQGDSDVETLLAALRHWGIANTLQRVVGTFALAMWDRKEHQLILARDRIGEKPLYYGWQGDAFLFGSELKALRAHPSFKAEIDRTVLPLYFRYGYIPGPYSIYRGIFKLPPGTFVRLGPEPTKRSAPLPYWSLREAAERGQDCGLLVSDDASAADILEERLKDAVRLRMVGDSPVGAFLSGGIDSSTIVALVQAQSARPVRTFAIGFHEDDYNEATYAKDVAAHLGTEHTELYVTPEEAMTAIPQLPVIYDEPFADASQIPTYLAARLARQSVSVVFTGDGGDELFYGYSRYRTASTWYRYIRGIPREVRGQFGRILLALAERFPSHWLLFRSKAMRRRHLNVRRVYKLASMLATEPVEAMYQEFVSYWRKFDKLVHVPREAAHFFTQPERWPNLKDFDSWMMAADCVTYLPDDILVKMDRAAMAVSLESRAPILDHRVVELAWQIPLEMKIREGRGKWLLRQVLYRYVPEHLVERPKMGFGIPLGRWLRGPLREWAEELLDKGRLHREGYLNPDGVRMKWEEHLKGASDWQGMLWNVLMFQAWLETERNHATAVSRY